MHKIIHILFILLPLFSLAQKDTIAHLYAIGGIGIDVGESIEATSDGGYIIVGSNSTNTTGNTDVYLLKVDSLINIEWSYSLGGTNNDWGYAVKQTYDKGYIIATSSNSYGNGGYDAVLMKRDSLGNYEWTKKYGGNDWDFVYDLTITYDSGFVFCGETYNNTAGQSDVFVVRTNKNGDTLWTKTIGGNLIDKGNSIIETSDSSIVIAGMTTTTTDSVQMYMIKLSPTGNLIWDVAYGPAGYEEANSVIETANGDYVLGGVTTSFTPNNDNDFYLIRADSSGNFIWGNYFGNQGEEIIYDIVELADGDFFNTGHTTAAGNGGKDALVFKITSNGLWGFNSSTFGGTQDEESKSIVLDANEDIKIAGFTKSFGNGLEDVMIIVIDTVVTNHQFTVDTINDFMPLKIDDLTSWQPASEKNVLIFPNPSASFVNFDISKIEVEKILIITIFGQIVYEANILNKKLLQINLESFSSGIYSVQFYNKNKLIEAQKLIIRATN